MTMDWDEHKERIEAVRIRLIEEKSIGGWVALAELMALGFKSKQAEEEIEAWLREAEE